MTTDELTVTKIPGNGASSEQLIRQRHGYGVALEHSRGKTVLEVACGDGVGPDMLARQASFAVGGDYPRFAHVS